MFWNSLRWLLACALLSLLPGCITVPVSLFGGRSELEEETIEPARKFRSSSKVALLTLDGVISGGTEKGLLDKDSTVVNFKDQIQAAQKDPEVRAVVLRIDSPGGDVTASDLIYREIQKYRKETGVPVFVSMMDLGASGAYYAAMAADRVYAHPTSIVGSIGVIAIFPKLQPLTQKVGLEMRVIKSSDSKDLGSPWRDFAPGEREILQGMIDEFYERFLAIVHAGRPKLSPEKIRELANGRVYTAAQAEKEGLIDGVLYIDEVIEAAKQAAGLKDAKLVGYRQPSDYKGHLYAKAPEGGVQAGTTIQLDLGGAFSRLTEPSFRYMWAP